MLGAYQPHPDVINLISQGIISIIQSFPSNRRNTSEAIKKWINENGQYYVDAMISDYNRKNPPRGPAPRALIMAEDNDKEKSITGEYLVESKEIKIYPKNRIKNFLRFMPHIESIRDFDSQKKDDFMNLIIAANMMSTIVHETMHHIQLSTEVKDDTYPWLNSLYEQTFYPYELRKIESIAWGIEVALLMAATVPPKYYSSINGPSIKSIMKYLDSKDLTVLFSDAVLLDYLADSFGNGIDTKFLDQFQEAKSKLAIEAKKDLLKVQYRDDTEIEKIVIDAFNAVSDDEIKLGLFKNYKLFVKNLNRYLRHFEPINRALAPYIPNL